MRKRGHPLVDKYDIMVIYVKAIPTFSFCKEPSFNWIIFDFNHDVIDKGIFTMKEIDEIPHFQESIQNKKER